MASSMKGASAFMRGFPLAKMMCKDGEDAPGTGAWAMAEWAIFDFGLAARAWMISSSSTK